MTWDGILCMSKFNRFSRTSLVQDDIFCLLFCYFTMQCGNVKRTQCWINAHWKRLETGVTTYRPQLHDLQMNIQWKHCHIKYKSSTSDVIHTFKKNNTMSNVVFVSSQR